MDGGVGEETGEEVGMEREAGTGGERSGCRASGVGRVKRWKDVETTRERAVNRWE